MSFKQISPLTTFLKHLAGAMAFLVPRLRPFFRGLRGAARARPTITMRGSGSKLVADQLLQYREGTCAKTNGIYRIL